MQKADATQRCEEAIERYQRQAALANSVLSVITMVYLGLLLGYNRVKLQKQMAAPEVEPLPLSILLHCVPCTSPCALCQEARAAAAYELVPIQPPLLMSRTLFVSWPESAGGCRRIWQCRLGKDEEQPPCARRQREPDGGWKTFLVTQWVH